MYVVGTAIIVTWDLPPNASAPAATVFDVLFVPSNLAGTYTDAAIINYVAPTATTAGSLQYQFTPAGKGLFRLYLEDGTASASNVNNEQWFWVLYTAPVAVTSLNVLGAISFPKTNDILSSTAFIGDWYRMYGACEDPSNTDLIWICGWELFGDTLGAVAKISKTGQNIVEVYKNLAFGTDPQGIAMMPNGRLVITRQSIYSGSSYRTYYSDAPYTSWTVCTLGDGNTDAAGAADVWYDAGSDVVWWQLGTQLRVSIDGATFYQQYYDHTAAGQTAIGPSSWHQKIGTNLVIGQTSIGGGGERINYTTTEIKNAPFTYTLWDHQDDMFGAEGTKTIRKAALSLAGTKMLFIAADGFCAESASGYSSFTVRDHSAVFGSDSPMHMVTIPDWSKIFIATINGSTWKWWESADDLQNISLSSDTRITGIVPVNNYFQTYCDTINSGNGLVAIHYNNVGSYSLAVTV